MTLLIDMPDAEGLQNGLEAFMRHTADTAARVLSLPVPVEISLVLSDNEHIRELNRQYRGLDKPTDVLSFPLIDLDPEQAVNWRQSLNNAVDPGSGEAVLGDIVISLDAAKAQSEEYGHSIMRELGFLLIHGMLHLLGYDHEGGPENGLRMRALEEEILRTLNLTRDTDEV